MSVCFYIDSRIGASSPLSERRRDLQVPPQVDGVALPSEPIPAMFESLKEHATSPALRELTRYIENQWVQSLAFTPKDWGVYGKPTRTNNDIEGTFILKIEW